MECCFEKKVGKEAVRRKMISKVGRNQELSASRSDVSMNPSLPLQGDELRDSSWRASNDPVYHAVGL